MLLVLLMPIFFKIAWAEESQIRNPFRLACDMNCEDNKTDISHSVHLRAKCDYVCGTDYSVSWSISPHSNAFDIKKNAVYLENKRYIQMNLSSYAIEKVSSVYITAKAKVEKTKESLSQSIKLELITEKQEVAIRLRCLKNCGEFADSDEDLTLTIICNECKGKYRWYLYPWPTQNQLERIIYENNSARITLPAAFYMKDINIKITGMSPISDVQTSRVIKYKVYKPDLVKRCIFNCEELHSESTTKYEASCLENCGESYFDWHLSPKIKKAIIQGPLNNTIIIPARSVRGGVSLIITLKKGGRGLLEEKITFRGDCSIHPKDGYSGITKFSVECNYGPSLNFTIYQKIGGVESDLPGVLLHRGTLKNVFFWLSEADPAIVTATIESLNLTHQFEVKVEKYRNETTLEDDDRETVRKSIMNLDSDHSLASLIKKKDYEKVVQFSSLLITKLQSIDDPVFRRFYRKKILEKLTTISDDLNPDGLLSILTKLSIDEEETTGELIAESLYSVTQSILKLGSDYKTQSMNQTMKSIIMIAAYLTRNRPDTLEKITIDEEEEEDDYPSYAEMDILRSDTLLHLRQETLYTVRTVEALGDMQNKVKQIPQSVNDKISSLHRYLNGSAEKVEVEGLDTFVEISSQLADELNSSPVGVKIHFAVFDSNPFWWDDIAKNITSEVAMVTLKRDKEKISSLEEPIDIFLKTEPVIFGNITGEVEGESLLVVHTIEAKEGGVLQIIFHTPEGSSYKALVTESYPSVEEVKGNGLMTFKERPRREKTWAVKSSIVYIAIARTVDFKGHYTIEINEINCISWKGDTWNWSEEGCTAVDSSSAPEDKEEISQHYTHCRCNHLSLFGAVSFVPPNHFSSLVDMSLSEIFSRSAVVLILLISVLIAYIFFMVLAIKRDNFLNKQRVHHLADTMPGDSHLYLTGVTTGVWRNAGTSANVAIQLLGTKSNSRVHLLHGKHLLERGNVDWFAIFTPDSLGSLRAIRLFHDSFGKEPHWSMCSDLVYVILFPQLLMVVHFKHHCNTYGSLSAYIVACLIRFTGGEPELKLPALIEYPGYDKENLIQNFPFRTMAMLMSLATLVFVSWLTKYVFESGKLAPGYDLFQCVVNIPEDALRVDEPIEGEMSMMTTGAMGKLYGATGLVGTDEMNGRINPALEADDDVAPEDIEKLKKGVKPQVNTAF